MKLQLVKRKLKDAPRADVRFLPFKVPALAWCGPGGIIYYVRRGRRRIAHEVEHKLAPDFLTNDKHHNPLHFCGRVGHAVRLWDWHLNPHSLDLAEQLLGQEDGFELEAGMYA